ncbi:hypothetical protein [Sorangium sp. So ce887]|uniref:hypothetical protein n=1 Tax=Sorangium sp. So ce887 TaxID=3133324 RepID=UPI003F6237D1
MLRPGILVGSRMRSDRDLKTHRRARTIAVAAVLLAWLSGCADAQATAGAPEPRATASASPRPIAVVVERGVEYTRAPD